MTASCSRPQTPALDIRDHQLAVEHRRAATEQPAKFREFGIATGHVVARPAAQP
ncbi:hypothetical protein [Streptomyces sp. NBC_00872]|uniref:hypothetical protein n=1 Tax=Streptomyces sp. NBC_00872 TaxID=2903686 RepID=UPI0038692107|nr:hypothetical protein OG214_34755 [Streptomyces sp. NBC_00872]